MSLPLLQEACTAVPHKMHLEQKQEKEKAKK